MKSCLWPQTVGGHKYRAKSPEGAAREIAKQLGKLGLMWSCNARASVNYETLKTMRDNGLWLLLVGYESGNQQILDNIKKGIRLEEAREFTANCKKLGITIHGTFILGLPGETHETRKRTFLRFLPHGLNPVEIDIHQLMRREQSFDLRPDSRQKSMKVGAPQISNAQMHDPRRRLRDEDSVGRVSIFGDGG